MKKLISSIGPSLKTRVAQAIINGNITDQEAAVQQMIDRVLHNSRQWSQVINCHVGSAAEIREIDEIERLFTPEAVAMCPVDCTDVIADPWFQGKPLDAATVSTLNSIPDSWYRRAYYSVTKLKNHNIRGSNGKSLLHILATYPEGFESKILNIARLFLWCLKNTTILTNSRCSKGFLSIYYLNKSIGKAKSDQNKNIYRRLRFAIFSTAKPRPPERHLHQAVDNHDLEAVVDIFNGLEPADINSLNGCYETPLFRACRQEQLPMVRLLLGLGADPDIAQPAGYTCLYYVRHSPHIPQVLLAAGIRSALPPHMLEENSSSDLKDLNRSRGCILYTLANPIPYLIAGDELVSERAWEYGNYGYNITVHTNRGDIQEGDPKLYIPGTIIKGVKIVPPKVSERWRIFNEALQDSFSSIDDTSYQEESCREERMRIFLYGWAAIDINEQGYPHLATVNSRAERIELYAERREAIDNRYHELYIQFVVPNRALIYANQSFSVEEKRSIAEQCNRIIRDSVIRFRCRWRATYNTQASRAARIESLK